MKRSRERDESGWGFEARSQGLAGPHAEGDATPEASPGAEPHEHRREPCDGEILQQYD